jgi:transcriptional regulator with XRE-family HTH domain
MDFNKLRTIIKQRKLTFEELGERIGMSKNGINLAFNNEELKVSTLERIAEVLDVSVSIFFDLKVSGEINEPQAAYGFKCKNCQRLEQSIDNQNLLIKELRDKLNPEQKKKVS